VTDYFEHGNVLSGFIPDVKFISDVTTGSSRKKQIATCSSTVHKHTGKRFTGCREGDRPNLE
jgi:hypothetical protein